MSFWKRLLSGITGKAKHRLPDEMILLGAPKELAERVRTMSWEKQEVAFMEFVSGKHACMLDWRAAREDVFAELFPLLTPEEKKLLPREDQCPDDVSATVATLRQAMSAAGRTLIRTESAGDFTFLVILPKIKEQEFIQVAGPWLVRDQIEK